MKEYVYMLHNNDKNTFEIFVVKANECKIELPYYDEENDIVWYPLTIDNITIEFKNEIFPA